MTHRNARRHLAAFLVIAVVLALPLPFRAVAPPPCSESAGLVDGFTLNGLTAEKADLREVSVERGGTPVPMQKGLPLCYGDVIVTGPQVAATIFLAAPPAAPVRLTLAENTTTQLVDQSSILLKLGRLFVSLHGRFEIRTFLAKLSAGGTEFEVNVTPDNLEVIQLSGTLEVIPESVALLPPLRGLAQAFRHDLVLEGYGTSSEGWKSYFVPASIRQETPVKVDRLKRLTMSRRERPDIQAADETLVRRVVDNNSATIVATRPALPSQNIIRVFPTADARAAAYRVARFETIWDPSRAEMFERLGDVYADWAEADSAVRAYKEAGSSPHTGQALATYHNNLGNIRRLAGDLDSAEESYRQALAIDLNFAFPYNGLGDVYRDRALAAVDRGQTLLANDLGLKARDYYQQSLGRELRGKEGGPNRAIALTNLGNILVLLGEWSAARTGQVDRPTREEEQAFRDATRYFEEAESRFNDAQSESPDSPFAVVGFGRLWAAQARMYEAQKQIDPAKQALAKARTQLEKAVSGYPKFSVAQQALGVFLDQIGEPDQATAHLQQATALDPQNALAYFQLATSLSKLGRSEEARPYFRTYLHIESPAFTGGARLNEASLASLPVRPPNLVGMTRSAALETIRNSGFVAGTIVTKTSKERADSVIDQEPKQTQAVSPGAVINLVVSSPVIKMIKVPNVVGKDQEKAAKEIADKGFVVGKIVGEASCESSGKVLRQDPPKDSKIAEKSSITIVVGTLGDTPTQMPKVNAIPSLAEAERLIQEAGLFVKQTRTEKTNSAKPGAIVGQNPKPGTALPKGCGITLTTAVEGPKASTPNFIGKDIAQVRKQLPSGFAALLSDFKLGTVTEQESARPAGTVISQNPQPGTRFPAQSATPVDLVIARPSGPAGVVIP
ncbi:MAG TPA: PASTA domain-containing protein [Terriglobia bacterium]|nr:PASTA domain-containing protein [Terriglobia bacterium]